MKHTGNEESWTEDEWVCLLEEVIAWGQGWLQSLPLRNENEIPSVSAAKQLSEEACEFATSISNAVKSSHMIAAFGNLRLLSDRLLHATWFFENPEDVTPWEYWSLAEIDKQISDAMSRGAADSPERESLRAIRKHIRHWNRSEEYGEDRLMSKPSEYDWNETRRELTKGATPRIRSSYAITSTYAHPTYRGHNPLDLSPKYVLKQAVISTCFTFIVSGAVLISLEGEYSDDIDPHLHDLMKVLDLFIVSDNNLSALVRNPPSGLSEAKKFYICAAIVVMAVFGRNVIDAPVLPSSLSEDCLTGLDVGAESGGDHCC